MHAPAATCFVLIIATACCGLAEDKTHQDESEKQPKRAKLNPGEEKITFSSPRLTPEDRESAHMPEDLRCDACTAVAFQMTEYLKKAQQGRNKALKESQYMEALDESCLQNWEQYGLKEVDGVKRLSGPGLETENEMGMVMLGGPWPQRLFKMCHKYLGDHDETKIYQEFRNNPDSLEDYLCYGNFGVCTKLSEKLKINSQKKEL